jgi:1,4-alpha-glucan branching enzyme
MNNLTLRKQAENMFSGHSMRKPIHFFCEAPRARSVSLIGDFNGWNPAAHPMERQVDGSWFLEVPLSHGHHEYLFLVDGKPTPDTHALGSVRNKRNELVSLVAVS